MDITEIIRQKKNDLQKQKCSFTSISTCENDIAAKYGSVKEIMLANTPAMQMQIGDDEDLCHFGDFPTLFDLKNGYQGRTDIAWLMIQITDLSEYCGCKWKLTSQQIEQCAAVICGQFGWLKITEIMRFCWLFKAGKYGKFYGNVDPMVITTALRTFIRDRADIIDHHESEINFAKIREGAKDGISYDEYLKLKGKQ